MYTVAGVSTKMPDLCRYSQADWEYITALQVGSGSMCSIPAQADLLSWAATNLAYNKE